MPLTSKISTTTPLLAKKLKDQQKLSLFIIYSIRKVKVPSLLDNSVVLEVAKKHNKTSGQVLLRFLAQQGIAVLAKSVGWARIKSNFKVTRNRLANDL